MKSTLIVLLVIQLVLFTIGAWQVTQETPA